MKYPEQKDLYTPVEVCFNYDTSKTYEGFIIRQDATDPYTTIILLNDGRVVLDTECQYKITGKPVKEDDRAEKIKVAKQYSKIFKAGQ